MRRIWFAHLKFKNVHKRDDLNNDIDASYFVEKQDQSEPILGSKSHETWTIIGEKN